MGREDLERILEVIKNGLQSAEDYLLEDLDAICDDTMREYAEDALGKVNRAVRKMDYLLGALGLLSNRDMACDLLKEEGFFYITSVHRDDLEARGFDTSEVTDEQMMRLASKMSDDYCTQLFHDSMEIIAEDMGIPKKDETDDEEE